MDDNNVMDPQENPEGTGHLPSAGEAGNGPVSYHDPVTQPTDDSTDGDEDTSHPQPGPGEGDAAGLS